MIEFGTQVPENFNHAFVMALILEGGTVLTLKSPNFDFPYILDQTVAVKIGNNRSYEIKANHP